MGLCVGILNRKIGFQGIIGHPNSCCNPSCRSIYSINTITALYSHNTTEQAIAKRTTPCKGSRELLQYLGLGVSTL